MSLSSLFRQTKILLILVTVFSAFSLFFVFTAQAQSEVAESFCALESPVLVSISNTETKTITDRLANTIVLQNVSSYHIGGLQVALGVFKGEELTHIYVAQKDVTLEPGNSHSVIMDIDTSSLLQGEYSYRAVAVQGDISAVISNLLTKSNRSDVPFTKETESERRLNTVVNGLKEIERGGDIDLEIITTNVSTAPLFEAGIDVVLTKGTIPFGTAVLTSAVDEAKLFPGSSRKTTLTSNFAKQGPHTVYVVQHIPSTLLPITKHEIQVGDLEGSSYATQLSVVGIRDVEDSKEEVEVVSCLQQLSRNEVTKQRVENVPIQISQTGEIPFKSELLFSEMKTAIVSSMPVLKNEGVTTVSLLENVQDEENRIDFPKQEISLSFDCDRHGEICGDTIVDVAVDFAQTEPVQQSFWFYAGIVLAALLLMLLVVRRMDPQPKDHNEHEHSEHELH